MKKIIIEEWRLKEIIDDDGVDPTEPKLLERGTFTVETTEISASCDMPLLSSKYLENDAAKTFGEASSAIDRALEAAFSVMNDQEKALITIEIHSKYVNTQLKEEFVHLQCICCVSIISNGKRVYEYSPAEILEIGSIYKNLSSKLTLEGCECNDFPIQLSAFYLLERSLQWLSLIHPQELEVESETYLLLRRQCYNNMALLQLNFGNSSAVEAAATFVIAEDRYNVKALYRRAVANINLQNYGLAKSDLALILTLEPNNKAAKSQIKVLESKSSKLDQQYAEAMRKFLHL